MIMFIKLTTENTIEQYPYSLEQFRSDYRNVSFPSDITDKLLEGYNVFPVRLLDKPEHDSITQYTYLKDVPEFTDTEWTVGWNIGQKNQNWMDLELEEQKKKINKQRDDLLLASDWVSIRAFDTNNPISTDWLNYRQSLRDTTAQEGYPWNVIWPEKPAAS